MKKLAGMVLVLILVGALSATSVFAAPRAGRGNGMQHRNSTRACVFLDANNDGICDTCPSGGTRAQDGTGRKSGRGTGNGCNRF